MRHYKKALDWLETRKKNPKQISIDDILKIHQLTMDGLLPKEKTGHLRPGEIYIVDVVNDDEKVRYHGPKSNLLPDLLSQLFSWLELEAMKLHPVLAASIFHYEFVSIHPFSDGNGRATRLLTMIYLSLRKYDFKGVLVPEIYYLEHRMEYYNSLNQANEYDKQRNTDLTPWIEFFIKGFLISAKQLKTEITIAQAVNPRNETIRLSQEEIQLLDFVKQMGSISLEETLEILQIPRRTAQRRLSELVNKGLLLQNNTGKNTNYITPIIK